MGNRVGNSYTNLFRATMIENFINSQYFKPKFSKRFRDDIFIISTHDQELLILFSTEKKGEKRRRKKKETSCKHFS